MLPDSRKGLEEEHVTLHTRNVTVNSNILKNFAEKHEPTNLQSKGDIHQIVLKFLSITLNNVKMFSQSV